MKSFKLMFSSSYVIEVTIRGNETNIAWLSAIDFMGVFYRRGNGPAIEYINGTLDWVNEI